MRKKEHRKIVRYMKQLNKQIGQDAYFGLNRFRIDMYSEKWYKFNDGSGLLYIIFKLSDSATGNTAYFIADNYDYDRKISEYANDFLIRCSSCHTGHYPLLNYIAYDVHDILPYNGDKYKTIIGEENVLCTYSRIKSVIFKEAI